MNTTKVKDEYNRALSELGLDTNNHTDDRPVIYLGACSSDAVTLAKAIIDCTDEYKVVLLKVLETPLIKEFGGYLEVTQNGIQSTIMQRPPRYASKSSIFPWVPIKGNARKIADYTENKALTHSVLSAYGVPILDQITLGYTPKDYKEVEVSPGMKRIQKVSDLQHKEAYKEINSFLSTHGSAVLKPISGSQGSDVVIIRATSIKECDHKTRLAINESLRKSRCILQKYIPSYKIESDNEIKDWNLRVLVSFDYEAKKYIVVGITGRIDTLGGPVNRSIMAENISLDEIANLGNISTSELKKLKERINTLSLQACSTLIKAGERHMEEHEKFKNQQCLFGIDIIVDQNLGPHIMEINDVESGCMYELMLLESIESIYPIARAIIGKLEQSEKLNKLVERNHELGVWQSHVPKEYMKGNIELYYDKKGKIRPKKSFALLKAKIQEWCLDISLRIGDILSRRHKISEEDVDKIVEIIEAQRKEK